MRLSLSCLALAFLSPLSAFAQSGGPDGFGYTWQTVPMDWVDLTVEPSAVDQGYGDSNSDDDREAQVTLPWAFPYYDGSYPSIRISDNGAIRFSTSGNITYEAVPLPAGDFSPDVAPWWGDWNGGIAGTAILSWHDSVHDRFILSWTNVENYDYPGNSGAFQLQLHGNGDIGFHYLDTDLAEPLVDAAAQGIIGIQDRIGGNNTTTDNGFLSISEYETTLLTGVDAVLITRPIALDADGDGFFGGGAWTELDCDDNSATTYPGAPEDLCDPADNDCGGDGNVGGSTVTNLFAAPGLVILDNYDPLRQATTQDVVMSGPILDVDVTLNITHTWMGDVQLWVAAPDGTEVRLTNQDGGEGDDFVNTRFDDEAVPSIGNAQAWQDPFTGSWQPNGDLFDFDGLDPNGTWTLYIQDAYNNDVGTVNDWTLHIAVAEQANDLDGDGFMDACGDCDDSNASVYPGAPEVCDGLDNNCDGIPEGDADGDGIEVCAGDCDDGNAAIYPGAIELCDGIDSDCSGFAEPDTDGDGVRLCSGDCDDNDSAVFPGAPETCDGIDSACNGGSELDADGDGFRACGGDCNDNNSAVNPSAVETCDGLDTNCDGIADVDGDGDGVPACAGDCQDADNTVYPGAPESCDGVDTDCDGASEADADGDGYRACAGDCDDGNHAVYPGAPETCDGMDSACDGGAEPDADADGTRACAGDCDDSNPLVEPGNIEVCDGLDSDCSGAPGSDEVDGDGDGVTVCAGDCDGGNSSVFPGAIEDCFDGLDDDCDTFVDGLDPDCLTGDDDSASGDDDSAAGDDDSASGDDDSAAGDDDSTSGDDDSAAGDDDSTSGDDDSTPGDDDSAVTGDDDDTSLIVDPPTDGCVCVSNVVGGQPTGLGAAALLLSLGLVRGRRRQG